MKFNIKAMALTCGIFWGMAVFLMTWWLIILEGSGGDFFINRFYVGSGISPVGSVIGLVYGLVDGAICGAIFAWLYNFISAKMQINF